VDPVATGLPQGYTISPLRLDHAEALAAAYARNREHLAPWDPARDADFYTTEGQRQAVAGQLELADRGLLAAWVVERQGAVVGRVNLNNIVRSVLCSAAVGYWVDHEHLRRGLARAGVEHACAQALALGLHRVEAGTLVHNAASQRVLLSAGFEHYGTAPEFLYIAGAWRDHHLYQRILHDDPPPDQPTGTGT
jgi:ribosomal-protein-alanine N-acetyltransferase